MDIQILDAELRLAVVEPAYTPRGVNAQQTGEFSGVCRGNLGVQMAQAM